MRAARRHVRLTVQPGVALIDRTAGLSAVAAGNADVDLISVCHFLGLSFPDVDRRDRILTERDH